MNFCGCNGLYILDISDSWTNPICFDCRLPKKNKNWREVKILKTKIKELRNGGK